VLASVLFGFAATVMELLFPTRVLPVLLNIVGSTCLLVWTISLASQLVLRRRADRAGLSLPFRMAAFPWLTGLALAILALIFALLLYGEQTRLQFLSMVVLTAFIASCSALARRIRAGRR
jgi:AAT family amino acid transporter